jgi:hypothetical protein
MKWLVLHAAPIRAFARNLTDRLIRDGAPYGSPGNKGNTLADPHQVNALIATAICDCRKDQPEQAISPEEAKHMAKCILEALSDAGLQIFAVEAPRKP